MLKTRFTEDEVEELLKTLVVIVDSREKINDHIIRFLDNQKIVYTKQKIDAGDYSAYIPKNEGVGLTRDVYLPVAIERKNSVDELVQSFKDRQRFENEFIRAAISNTRMYLLVEDSEGYRNIFNHHYKSKYDPKAFMGSLKSFEARYNFTTAFIDKNLSGHFIYSTLYYCAMQELKGGEWFD